jgi:hypothetical protein
MATVLAGLVLWYFNSGKKMTRWVVFHVETLGWVKNAMVCVLAYLCSLRKLFSRSECREATTQWETFSCTTRKECSKQFSLSIVMLRHEASEATILRNDQNSIAISNLHLTSTLRSFLPSWWQERELQFRLDWYFKEGYTMVSTE